MLVSILLVSYNLGTMTRDCIASIRQNAALPVEIVVVDNASNEETKSVLRAMDDIILVENDHNAGFPAACNIGAKHAHGDIIWMLNNDTFVPKGSLERMVELLLSDKKIGMIGPVSNRVSGIQQVPIDYEGNDDLDGIAAFAARNAAEHKGETVRVLRLVGFSMLMRKKTLDEIGGLDERMGIGTFEDDDFCLRMAKAGYRLYIARDAFIHHISNASFQAAGGYPPTGPRNQIFASTTARMTIPDETTLNEPLIAMLREDVQSVVHAECGAGAYGLVAGQQGIHARALESSPEKAAVARYHYEDCYLYTPGEDFVYDGADIEVLMIEKQLNDADALSLVRSIAPALKPGAQVLVQVPKITAIAGDDFAAYQDGWTAIGSFPRRGMFCSRAFVENMRALGFAPISAEMTDVRKGFFNRNAFARHLETAEPVPGG